MNHMIIFGAGLLLGLVASMANVVQQGTRPARPDENAQTQPDRPRGDNPENRPGERGSGGPGQGGPGPGGFGGFGGPGGPGGFGGQEREILKQFDTNSSGMLDKDERPAAREFLKKQPAGGFGGGRPGGPGGGPGGPGGRGGRGGFDPGRSMAKPLLDALDVDQDMKLSPDELATGVKRLVAEANKTENATLDQAKLVEVLNRILPPPPQFGGRGGPGAPGGGPPGDRPDESRRGAGRPELESDTPKAAREADPKPAQTPGPAPRREDRSAGGPGAEGPGPGGPGGRGPGPGGPGGFGFGPGGFGQGGFGPGTMIAGSIVLRADINKDGKLTTEELVSATKALFKEADQDKDGQLIENELVAGVGLLFPVRPGGFGPPGGFGAREPGKPGPKVSPADARNYDDESLYDPNVLRTVFLEFEDPDWETELSEFHNTDVEVPVTLTVDGKKYTNVGVSFRGMSSYGMVPVGSKRSFNLSVDLANGKQRLLGYKTLNLLNAHEDPSFLSTVLYSNIARKHIPAPKANFVKVVINGESWGVYVNVQQFNKEFIAENYPNAKGTRWKVRGSPGGGGGLEYLGDNIEEYKRRYQIKSSDGDKPWKSFAAFCKTLNETPPDQLEAALKPILDIDEALWFLALDVALINNDGYWVRASDYSIYLDPQGKFHIVPHDMNEAFHGAMMGFGGRGPGGPGGGPGGPGGPGGGPGGPNAGPRGSGVELDPLVALDDARKPLRSKLLAVPSLKARYLEHVRQIAAEDLDWKSLQPVVSGYRKLIENEIKADTRKLTSFAEFEAAMSDKPEIGGAPEGRRRSSLRSFIEQRREYLLKYQEPKKPNEPKTD